MLVPALALLLGCPTPDSPPVIPPVAAAAGDRTPTILLARHPALKVLIFGQGPLEAELRAEVDAAGLAGAVRFTGFRHDLPRWLGGLDMLEIQNDAEVARAKRPHGCARTRSRRRSARRSSKAFPR